MRTTGAEGASGADKDGCGCGSHPVPGCGELTDDEYDALVEVVTDALVDEHINWYWAGDDLIDFEEGDDDDCCE
jgi:hypothetical protein